MNASECSIQEKRRVIECFFHLILEVKSLSVCCLRN